MSIKLPEPRLFIGPMSKQIVDVAAEYSAQMPVGLIPSRRQVEYTGGYVNNWTTQDFITYVQNKNSNLLLVRDHGGPGQGIVNDDGLISIKNDINAGFHILHIDPWVTVQSVDEGISKTLNLLNFCMAQDDDVMFEIGTEQAIFKYEPADFNRLLVSAKKMMGTRFDRIKYGVVQSGTRISGTNNAGNLDKIRLKEMTAACVAFGILSKEHNGDYLAREEILERVDLGLDCINIAPEFGVTQTRILLNIFDKEDKNEAYKICKKLGKYKKWLPENISSPSQEMIVELSGHYSFVDEPFAGASESVKTQLRTQLFHRFNEIIGCWNA